MSRLHLTTIAFLTLLTASALFAEIATTVERPQGEYHIARLTLTQGDVKREIVLGLRDGRGANVWIGTGNPFIDAADMRYDGKSLRGVIEDRHHVYEPGSDLRFEIDAKVSDTGDLRGTYKARLVEGEWNYKSAKLAIGKATETGGEVTGRVMTAEQLKAEQAIASGAAWPSWQGPTGDRVATPSSVKLVDDLRYARLVWKSEARIAAAPGPSKDIPRTMGDAPMQLLNGGGASPIVANGKVFLRYSVPSGQVYDEELYKKYVEAGLPVTALAQARKVLAVSADDVVICFDASTGQTLWQTTMPGAGVNIQGHKTAQNNLTPLYHDGRVYAIGSTLRMYCLDAESGKPLWHVPIGEGNAWHEQMKATCLAKKIAPSRGGNVGNRNYGYAPIGIAGLVLSNDHKGNLIALDAKTGSETWRVKGIGANDSPHPWRHDGRDYVIFAGREAITCLTAEKGEQVWTISAAPAQLITVSGDVLAYCDKLGAPDAPDREKEDKSPLNDVCVVYQLTSQGPKLMWTTKWQFIDEQGQPYKNQYSHYGQPLIAEGRLYLSGHEWTDCYDLETGKHLGRATGMGVYNAGHMFFAHGRLFTARDGKHSQSDFRCQQFAAAG